MSVTASLLFALLSGYTNWLAPLDGLDIFAWRIIWTLPFALLLVLWHGRGRQLWETMRKLLGRPANALLFLATTSMFGVQLWLFLWAPVNGRALDVSLGYFLLPLVMVLIGRFHYRERLGTLQWLAVACAAAGVLHELWAMRTLSWPTLLVALGYPPYFMLRRRWQLDSLLIFTTELMLLMPVACFALSGSLSLGAVLHQPSMYLLLPGLGILSAAALDFYLRAGRQLPMALFGILSYVEPVLLVGVAVVFLGEPLSARQLGTYVPIWMSVIFTAIHSLRLVRRSAGVHA